jgi:hypothetical protein
MHYVKDSTKKQIVRPVSASEQTVNFVFQKEEEKPRMAMTM